jgi:para-nitrobenzyl esterase
VRLSLFFAFTVAASLLPTTYAEQRDTDSSPTISVKEGQLRGALDGTTAVFKGIPYAAAPISSLRWREPMPAQPWSGIRDATKPGSACVQNVAGLGTFIAPLAAAYGASYDIKPVSSSEDCLYLNIWSPNWPSKGPLPVMVWLHGGSNRIGSGDQSTYVGKSLASHGVIVVTINYRLGVMGFFSHPELTRESPHHSSGNYGLLDQLAALRWVRDNIVAFGGDPRNVTLFGESAGSIDAGLLVTSPLATGLFRRVILESGPPFRLGSANRLQQAEAVGAAIGKAAPGHSKSTLENLRSLPATQVVELASQTIKTQFKGFDPLGQLVDGWVLPQTTSKAFGSGTIQKVDFLVGLNGRELSAFRIGAAAAAKQNAAQEKGGGAGDAVKKLADTAHPLYGGWTDAALAMYLSKMVIHRDAAIDQASNDILMACPIGAVAALASNFGRRVYVYKFDRSIPGKGEADLGAFHGLEVPYVFNTFEDRSWRWLPFTEIDHKLSQLIETYWTNFAKTGDPNAGGLPAWPPWQSSEPYLEFNQDGSAIARKDFAPPFCHLSPERLKQQLTAN